MRIEKIDLQNFRCFTNASVKLHPQFTLIAGNNGSGKSTILDALAVGIGSFFLGIDGIRARSIYQNEVRYETYEFGDVINRENQYPASLSFEGTVYSKDINWTRCLSGKRNNTTYGGANEILKISRDVSQKVMKGSAETILPIIAYYGTGHLWAHTHRRERIKAMPTSISSRFGGYIDCLDTMSDIKLMYKWFAKMTFQAIQTGKSIPVLEEIQKALVRCFNGKKDYNSLGKANKIYFNVKTGTIEIEYDNLVGKKESHPLDQMSDGYQNMLSIVSDIAYRMAVLNPQLMDKTLEKTPGVVLIDEIDLHLHPAWQKHVIEDLCDIFPNVQFVATSHSPSVISSIHKENIVLIENRNIFYPYENTYGKDANSILREFMGVTERLDEVKDLISVFYSFIDEREFSQAKETLSQLRSILGDNDTEVTGAEVSLKLESME